MKVRLLILLVTVLLTACNGDADNTVKAVNAINNDPATVNALAFDRNKADEYSAIAKKLGFNYDQEYYYNSFVELLKSKGLGAAGGNEYFNGSSNDWFISPKAMTGWVFMYYKNADVTMIYQIRHNEERTNSYVRLLKLANGRVPDLNKQ